MPGMTDMINTLAVVVGISVGVYELSIRDRDMQRVQREAAMRMIEQGNTDAVNAARTALMEAQTLRDDAEATRERWREMHAKALPLASYYSQFLYCWHARLCDRDIAEMFLCGRIGRIERNLALVAERGGRRSPLEADADTLARLREACGARS
ncbi:MAG: hypothetical protein IT557_18855 [Alphaproteobacteria bacterium]|nr:hypothetical protein [Alphaproteobacteria bacterium]